MSFFMPRCPESGLITASSLYLSVRSQEADEPLTVHSELYLSLSTHVSGPCIFALFVTCPCLRQPYECTAGTLRWEYSIQLSPMQQLLLAISIKKVSVYSDKYMHTSPLSYDYIFSWIWCGSVALFVVIGWLFVVNLWRYSVILEHLVKSH